MTSQIDDLIGTPFYRSDCWRTARSVLELKGIPTDGPTEREAWIDMRRRMDHHPVVNAGWTQVSTAPQDGDLLVMRAEDGSETHLGVVDGARWVIHSTMATGVCRARLTHLLPLVVAVYRHGSRLHCSPST